MEEYPPDVIPLDLMMPVLDGWGVVLEALKDRSDRPPIIMVTVAQTADGVDRANQLGVTAYVTKPFNVAGLVELVHSIGRPRRRGRRASKALRPARAAQT
jgi:DNA-binding response OmpR family regulator